MEQLVRIARLVAGVLAAFAVVCLLGEYSDTRDAYFGHYGKYVNFSTLIAFFAPASALMIASFVRTPWASKAAIAGAILIAVGTAIPIAILGSNNNAGTLIMIGIVATIVSGTAAAAPLVAKR